MFIDYYYFINLFGLKPGASSEDIKREYKNIAKKVHPDKGGSVEKFKELNEGYEYLKKHSETMKIIYENRIPIFIILIIGSIFLVSLLSTFIFVISALSLVLFLFIALLINITVFYEFFISELFESTEPLEKQTDRGIGI